MKQRRKKYKYDPNNAYGAFGSGPAKKGSPRKGTFSLNRINKPVAFTGFIVLLLVGMVGFAAMQYFRQSPAPDEGVPLSVTDEPLAEDPSDSDAPGDPPEEEPRSSSSEQAPAGDVAEDIPLRNDTNTDAPRDRVVEEELAPSEEQLVQQSAMVDEEENQEVMYIGGDE